MTQGELHAVSAVKRQSALHSTLPKHQQRRKPYAKHTRHWLDKTECNLCHVGHSRHGGWLRSRGIVQMKDIHFTGNMALIREVFAHCEGSIEI